MSAAPFDRERGSRSRAEEDDVSIVPGLGPSTGALPQPRSATQGLDPALDPDRFDASIDAAPSGRLDPALDPDRYANARADLPPGQGQTLTELLGDGAFEEPRSTYQWAVGLLAVVVFLALVSWFFGAVVSP
jgi:hypothetical protein